MKKYLSLKHYLKYIEIKFITLLSPLIRKWEKSYIQKYSEQRLKHQPVFIIGAPRTGSTILYQMITNQYDVLYINNLVCKFYKNPFFGFWLSEKLFKNKAHNCFSSNHGDTLGLNSPSECGVLWYRWLPRNKDFVELRDFSEDSILEAKAVLSAIINYYNKPLMINNNNLGLKLRFLSKVFPDAKYIVADREPYYVAQSLLSARKYFYGVYDQWWSIRPKNIDQIEKETPLKQVVQQHYYINQQMFSDLETLVFDENWMIVSYEEFCQKSDEKLEMVSKLMNYKTKRLKYQENSMVLQQKDKLNQEESRVIMDEIERLNCNDY